MIERRVIYSGDQKQFFDDVLKKNIADIMRTNFENITGKTTSEPEFNSWDRSIPEIKNLVELSGLRDLYFSFEYLFPYRQMRIDCLIFGKNSSDVGHVVHIELKQWAKVEPTDIEGNFVETYTGGGIRRVAHPSQQVEGYHDYLMGFIEVFYEKELELFGCSYCHNYRKNIGEGLFDSRYAKCIEKYPIYTRNDIELLAEKIKTLLNHGRGFEIFNRFMQSPIRPSKKLLENVSKIIHNKSEFSLLEEQITARNTILDKIKKAEKSNEKNVIIIKGGPGTGKTVIALHILADMASSKKRKTIFFSSKSKPLIEAIKNVINSPSKVLFTNLNPFIPANVKENQIDVLIIDEAHRIGKTSNHQYTRKEQRTDMPQIEQLVRCAKTAIFFIDDKQIIRYSEVGSTELIKNAAKKYNCPVIEEELLSQFRCNGSDNYLEWLEFVLGYSKGKKILKKQDNFDFRIFGSPKELYETIKSKDKNDNSARLVAGYCWPWSKKLDSDGNLMKDIKIGDFEMPWETHEDVKAPPGYVRWYEWAYKPDGIKQIGCIYTAQGFEFDYIGVIIGPDLKYDSNKDRLVGDPNETKDTVLQKSKDRFDEYVKNIYRVLMTRGLKGCYVYFVDKDTEKYFRSTMENIS